MFEKQQTFTATTQASATKRRVLTPDQLLGKLRAPRKCSPIEFLQIVFGSCSWLHRKFFSRCYRSVVRPEDLQNSMLDKEAVPCTGFGGGGDLTDLKFHNTDVRARQ